MPSKKITLKLIDVYGLFISITETEKANKVIPFKLAWELADIKEAFKKSAVRLEEERNKIFKELGTPDGEDGNFKIEVENVDKLNKTVQDLYNTEIEVEFTPIPVSRFEAAKDFNFATGAFEALRKDVIEFPVAKPKMEAVKKEEPVEAEVVN
jgi:hypothetical protein